MNRSAALFYITESLTELVCGEGMVVDCVVQRSEGIFRLYCIAVVVCQFFFEVIPVLRGLCIHIYLLRFFKTLRLTVLQEVNYCVELTV